MRAVLCVEHGPPERLVVDDVPEPECPAGHVRIAVKAAGVNFPDVLITRGEYQFQPPMPFSPGGEIAGDVVEVGDGVERHAVGDRVFAMIVAGGYAEQVVVPEASVVRIPDGSPYDEAAVLPTTYLTSAYGLVERGHLQPGETLLVHGASGGVGLSAVQIGKELGAVVIATGGDDDKLAVAAVHGADHVVNYRTEPWRDRVKELTGGVGADVIYDPVGGDVFEQSLRCINWEGRLLVIGFASGTIPAAKANLILLKGCDVVGVFYGRFAMTQPEANRAVIDRVVAWWEAGKVKPHISHRFPLEQASDALYALINREVVGKAVLTVA